MTTKSGKTIPLWVDGLILLLMVGLIVLVAGTTWQMGAFRLSLLNDEKLSWHLVRSLGIAAYTLLGASTIWGLFLSSRIIKDWSPGTVSLLLHATVSWLAVVFTIAHMVLLLADKYVVYHVSDLLIPFTGPYRAIPVGLGTLATWILVPLTISFSMRKLIGQRVWRLLHYLSYVTFILITAHALLAGTDSTNLGLRLLVLLMVTIVGGLFALRIWRSRPTKSAKPASPTSRAARTA